MNVRTALAVLAWICAVAVCLAWIAAHQLRGIVT